MRKESSAHLLGGLLAVLALACGQKPQDQEPKKKNEANAATPTPSPQKPSGPDIFTKIPDTAFLAFHRMPLRKPLRSRRGTL